ncbi:Bgt-51079 [Blumeria graminis f. sp. tritici]|uniref:Bgt-51079 n=1 Tax=Blumeria graminis f. sp. tritici TaxID=62690 RepID=A0A9X9MIR6_BLUGR|nr:Bgt-51079 [Blumeria graminis f. sp. tritici]
MYPLYEYSKCQTEVSRKLVFSVSCSFSAGPMLVTNKYSLTQSLVDGAVVVRKAR